MLRPLTYLLFLLLGMQGHAQVLVNEVSSKNLGVVLDAFGATPDWIELHNAGSEPENLSGYHLSDDPRWPDRWTLPAITLEPDAYVVFFHGADNSDGLHFPFKLDSSGEPIVLSTPDLEEVDLFVTQALQPDHSAGRDAGGNIRVYADPTPGMPNTTLGYPGYAPTPEFSPTPGFRSGPVHVGVSSCSTCTVRMTWDASVPRPDSPIHTGSIHLQNTTVLKAFAQREGYLDSPVASGTYLFHAGTDLPVISLSVDNDSLFHDTLGLYMLGPEADTVYPHFGANFWDERGIDVRLEYFDEQGIRRIDQDVELRIHGGRASRNKPQRPLRLTARDRHGSDRINYGFFAEKPTLERFKRIILRNSGSDWCQAHYRDGFFHQVALHAGLDIDVLAFKPSVVYLNGRYWGIHNIRERIDKHYLASNHGVDPEALLLMSEENFSTQGDSLHFDSLQWFIRNHDMALEEHFAVVDSLMDLKSFTDYFALEIFAGNSDWPSNNLKYWKPSVHTGKWRYLMYDLDATMFAAPWIPTDFDMFYWILVHRDGFMHAEIFASLMENPEFRRGFLNRLADLMNTCLSPPALLAENELIRNRIRREIPRHFERWYTPVADWHYQSGEVLPRWMQERGDYIREDVLNWYGLPNTAQLTFDLFPREAGTLKVNTLRPDAPFDGIYFNGNAIDVSVEPIPGFTFSHWSYSAEPENTMHEPHLRRSFASDGTLVAHFSKVGATMYAFPNPTATHCEISYEVAQGGLVDVSLWDAQGRLLRSTTQSVVAGVNRIPMDLTGVAAGLMEVRVSLGGKTQHTRVVKH